MSIDVVGWDIGGAHIKTVTLAQSGHVLSVIQQACPLWKGVSYLQDAVADMMMDLGSDKPNHAITMTGELVDHFPNRVEGVKQLLITMSHVLPIDKQWVFIGKHGFKKMTEVNETHFEMIASANWLASAVFLSQVVDSALFIDIGSTTSDVILIKDKDVKASGYSDYQRLCSGELVYAGVVRTPVMAMTDSVLFDGTQVALIAEHFATAADVYRLTGDLPEFADQTPTADNDEKSMLGSARRLARMIGRDLESASLFDWTQLAYVLKNEQIIKLRTACEKQCSGQLSTSHIPLIGAGVGRFLVKDLADQLKRPYIDFIELFSEQQQKDAFSVADCAPAVSVANLMLISQQSAIGR